MGKFDGILFCSDVDGTLMNGKNPVSEKNIKAIEYFEANGGAFTACTGRHPRIVSTVLADVTLNAPIMGYNGAIIYDWDIPGEVRVLDLPKSILLDSIRFMESDPCIVDMVFSIWSTSVFLGVDRVNGGYVAPDGPFGGRHFDTAEEFIEAFPDEVIYKVLFRLKEGITPEESERIRDAAIERFGEYDVTRSWIRGVEINLHGASKGYASRFIAERMGKKLLVCAGDYENDRSMIKEADIGFVMENGVESLKAEADVIAPHCGEDGIAWIIDYLEKEIDAGRIKL